MFSTKLVIFFFLSRVIFSLSENYLFTFYLCMFFLNFNELKNVKTF